MKQINAGRWLAVALVLIGCLVCLQNARPRSVNEASRMALVESLLERGQTHVGQSPFFNTVDIVERSGRHYSDKPPLLSLYTTTLFRPFVPPLQFKNPADLAVLHRAAVLTLNGLALWALVIVMFRTCGAAGIGAAGTGMVDTALGGYRLVLGTLMLAYLPAYTSHFAEAVLTVCAACAVIADRSRPRWTYAVLAGICAGLQWSIHPLSGSVLMLATGFALGFWRWRQGWVFAATAAACIGAGLAAHQALYGTWKYFYFEPEGYLFLWGPDRTYLSTFFDRPINPGLTEEGITARVRALDLPDAVLARTLEHFRQYRESVADPIRFALERFRTQDFLAFNPLFFAAFLVWARGAWKSGRERWRETSWVVLMSTGMYAAAVHLRSQSGASFGNRHLIPAVAAILAGCWISSERERYRPLLSAAFLVSFPMMLPGLVRSWQEPNEVFLYANLILTLVFYVLAALWVFVPAIEAKLNGVWNYFEKAKVLWPAAVWGLVVWQFGLYRGAPVIAPAEMLAANALTVVVSVIPFYLPARTKSDPRSV